MAVIWIASSWVNAIIFFAIDIPVLWAIHRGLLVAQGYHMYHTAQRGSRVRIARSRIPLVSGELLRGATWFPSIFVLINIAALVVIFFATLGVNGETKDKWTPGNFKNSTTLELHRLFMTWVGGKDTLACSRREESRIEYWPIAFNRVAETEFGVRNLTCQKDAPGLQPMMTLQCVELDNKPCFLEDAVTTVFLNASTDAVSGKRWTFPDKPESHVLEYTVTNTRASGNQITREKYTFKEFNSMRGRAFEFRSPIDQYNNSIVIFLHDYTKSHLFIGSGLVRRSTVLGSTALLELTLQRPLALKPERLISEHVSLIPTIRSAFEHESVFEIPGRFLDRTTFEVAERLLLFSVQAGPIVSPAVAYMKTPNQKATEITTIAIVLYISLAIVAILLCFIKELVAVFKICGGNHSVAEKYANDFDQLSKAFRRQMEKAYGVPPSGSYSELGMVDGEQGDTQVSFLVS